MKDDGYLDANNTPFNQLGTVMGGYTFSTIPANARAYYEARARGEHPALYRAASPNEYEYEMQLENGSFIYYRISDNGYTLTIPAEDLQVTLNYANIDTELLAAVRELNLNLARLSDMQQQQIPFRSMGEELLDKLASIMDKIGEAMSKVSTELSLLKDYMDRTRDGFQIMIDGHVDDLYKSTKEGWEQFWATNSKWVNNDKFKIMQAKGAVAAMKMRDLRKAQQYLQNAAKWLGNLGKVINVVSLISDGNDLIDACSKLLELAYTIPDPCENDKEKADQIMFEFNTYGLARVAQKAYAFTNDALSVAAAIAGVATGAGTGGVGTVAGLAVSIGISLVNFVGNKLSDRYWSKWTQEWEKRIDELQCDDLPCKMKRKTFQIMANAVTAVRSQETPRRAMPLADVLVLTLL